MTATQNDVRRDNRGTPIRFLQVPAAAVALNAGAAAAFNAAGYVTPAANAAGNVFAGIVRKACDNSAGNAGDKTVQVDQFACTKFAIASASQAMVGQDVYFSDDNTVTPTPGACYAGTIAEVIDSTDVWVSHEPALAARSSAILPLRSGCVELNATVNGDKGTLIPARANVGGLAIVDVFGVITQVMAGASVAQPVVTLYASDDTALNVTITPSASPDALGAIIKSGGSAYTAERAATGSAGALVGAGSGVYAKITTPTSGSGAAGKIKLVAIAAELGDLP